MAVVDTHTVIWAFLRPELLSQQARDIFRQAQQQRLEDGGALDLPDRGDVSASRKDGWIRATRRLACCEAVQDPESAVRTGAAGHWRGGAVGPACLPRRWSPDMHRPRLSPPQAVHLGAANACVSPTIGEIRAQQRDDDLVGCRLS